MTMKSSNWYSSNKPEYRNSNWVRQDWRRGGTIEMHRDGWGRREFVRRNWVGDVIFRRELRLGVVGPSGRFGKTCSGQIFKNSTA